MSQNRVHFLQLILIICFTFSVNCTGECDGLFYSRQSILCYGELSDKSTDMCASIDGVSFIHALAVNPVTGEFFISATNSSQTARIDAVPDESSRFILKFNANLTSSGISIDNIVELSGYSYGSGEQMTALTFSCQENPVLYGLNGGAEQGNFNRTLFSIDQMDGTLTALVDFGVQSGGAGLYYNIERNALISVIGLSDTDDSATWYMIDRDSLNVTDGFTYSLFDDRDDQLWFASYLNETHWIGGSKGNGEDLMFVASLESITASTTDITDNRNLGIDFTAEVHAAYCEDYAQRCIDTFTVEPSLQPSYQPSLVPTEPSLMPSFMPSTEPSNLPSTDPSVMPTEMPVIEISTTAIPPEPTSSPTDADAGQRNAMNLCVLLGLIAVCIKDLL